MQQGGNFTKIFSFFYRKNDPVWLRAGAEVNESQESGAEIMGPRPESCLGRERECAVTETGTTWTIFQRATNPPAGWAALGSGESDWRVEAAEKISK